jgi:hypothetical protein
MPMERAKIINTEKDGKTIDVMFNPPSLNVVTSNSYADAKTPGSNQEKQQFIQNNSDIMSVEFFFDTTRTDTEVRDVVNPILDLAKVPKGAKVPPKLKFAWGAYVFDCVIISIDQTYDYFNSYGQALRATLKVKFRSIEPVDETAIEPAKPAQKAPAKKKVVKPKQDITCFCEDPKDWRPVAEVNNIDNPNLVSTNAMVGEELICKEENMSHM